MSDSGEKSFIHLILAKLGDIKIGEEERKTVSFGDPSAAAGGLIWSILSVSLVFSLWSIAVRLEWANPIFLPGPGEVWRQFWHVLTEGFRGSTLAGHLGLAYIVF